MLWDFFTHKISNVNCINVLFNYFFYLSISSGIHGFCMSYIDVVQYTSLSWLIHAWPYVTKRCSARLKDKEAETACETGSDKVITQFSRAFLGRCSLWSIWRTGRAVRKTTLDLDLSKILFASSYMPWLICKRNRETQIRQRTVLVWSSPPLTKKSTQGFRSRDNL